MSTGQHGGGFGTVFHPEPDPTPAGNGGPVRIGQLRSLPRRRRPAMIALAVVLIGAGILGGAEIYRDVNHQVPVLLITASVPVGTTVTAADLTVTSVAAGPGVKLVPARQESQVVGLVATTSLQPGTLLAASDLTSSLPPAGGQVLVPAALKPSQLPASGLAAGDHVVVVFTPSAQSGSGSAATASPPPRNVPAVVEAVTRSPDSDGLDVVDLLVPELAGPGLAREAATGDVALIVTSRVP
jgi:hypothetical protein